MSTQLLFEVAPSPPQPVRLPHVRELDGIRGLAALGVFFHHLLFTAIHPERHPCIAARAFFGLVSAAGLRMDIFFVLSGFLITSILLRDRAEPHFYWKRALRILPLYWLSLAIVAACIPANRRYVLISVLFLTNFCHIFHIAEAGPFWTLAIEEHFYLVWLHFIRHFSDRGLHRLALGLAIGCLSLRLLPVAFAHHDFRFTFFHCDGLALGALLACQRIAGFGHQMEEVRGRRHRWMPSLTFVNCALISLPLLRTPADRSGMAAEALRMTGTALLSYCGLRLIIEHSGSRVLAVLRSRVLLFSGSISYCLYIANLYLADFYDQIAGPLATGTLLRVAARMLIVFGMTVGVCMVFRYVIEKPAQRLRRVVLRHC